MSLVVSGCKLKSYHTNECKSMPPQQPKLLFVLGMLNGLISFLIPDERVGQLCCVLNNSEAATIVRSRVVQLARRMWSNSPNHGARIVATTLNNPTLYQEWLKDREREREGERKRERERERYDPIWSLRLMEAALGVVLTCRLENLITMNDRIKAMREKLYHQLRVLGTPGNWSHIVSQIGMFSFTGLTRE